MNWLKTTWLRSLLLGAALILSAPTAQAYHFPWDQGHDTFNWNDPTDPGTCQQSTCDPCNSTGSPVYIPTGHFVWSDSDIVLKGRPRIGLTRTYNSHDPRDGLFGNGWTVGCDVGLYKATDSGVTKYILRSPNGKRYEYTQQADGSVASPAGRFEQVVPQADGSAYLVYLDGSRKVFRVDGKLVADIDANGNQVNYSYDGEGRLTRIADVNGRYLDLTYNSRGRVASVSDHVSRQWQYAYDTDGNLTSRTDPLGGVRQYNYAPYTATGDVFTYQHLTKITDESGVVETQVTYSGERVVSYTEGANKYTYSYNTSTKTVTKTDILNSRWTFVYNDQGLITQETDPLGHGVAHVYDPNGRETQTTDELGKVWKATYDSLGRVTSRTNPLNETMTFSYSGNNPNPSIITTPSGRVTKIAYDAKFNPISITDPSGAVNGFDWNGAGDMIAKVDALGNRTQLTYNAVGQPIIIGDPLGRIARNNYDAGGNLIQSQSLSGQTSSNEYDALGHVVKTTDSMGGLTTRSYAPAGGFLSLTDTAGAVTAYEYDGYGRLTQRTAPDGRKTQFAYRTDNLLSQLTQPDNRTIGYSYDAAKRLTQENSAGQITTYTYDARNDLTQVTNPAGNITRAIDAVGRPIQETNNGKTVQTGLNSEGERASLAALGLTTSYSLDARGLVTGIANASGTYQFTYDTAGRRSQLRLPNAATVGYGYDAASQLKSIAHSGPFNTTYGYTLDNAGRIARMTGDGADWGYQYDALSRITRADHGADSFAYVYDAAGNIQNSGRVYDVANRLAEDNALTYTYDANGNLTQKQDKMSGARTVYAWNAKNQLISYQRYPDATSTTATKTLTFSYDAFGRRASKTDDGVVQRYVYDGEDLIGILDSGGNVIRSFTFGPGIDEPLGMTSSSGNRYFHANHLGSVMALTDGSAVTSRYEYDPYGATTASGEGGNPFRFTAREQDAEDLYYYRARYYDPTIQRFLSEDPIDYLGGINLYSYAGGNPVSRADPTGTQVGSPQWCQRQAERIRNIEQKIRERTGELDENPQNLPEACTGDDLKPSLSRRGHRKLINLDKANLAAQKALYAAYCNNPPPPPIPVPVPVPAPQPAPTNNSPFSQEYWEGVTGLTGAALITYIIISEGSRLFPPRNLVPVP